MMTKSEYSTQKVLTYRHRFDCGAVATAIIPANAPKDFSNFQPLVEWQGQPKLQKIIRPYIAWMNEVIRSAVNRWGVKLLYGYQVEMGRMEFWLFSPNSTPQLLHNKGKAR